MKLRASAFLGFLAILAAAAQGAGAVEPLAMKPVPRSPVADGFTVATVGDMIYLRPMLATLEARSPGLLRLLRGADAAFGNFETSALDLSSFKGSPQAQSGGTWMLAAPGVPADVKAMGVDLVSVANNHTTDWGVEGMVETNARLTAAGVVHAGSDRNLSAARAPRYLDLGKGRIGLVAATSTFPPMSRAADPLGEVPGRPGVNAIRTDRIVLLPPDRMAGLKVAAGSAGTGDVVQLTGVRYRQSSDSKPGFAYTANADDVEANLRSVRQASQNGNFTIFSLHTHEPDNESQTPADFAVSLAHRVIDEGADMFVGHGPHQLRGIEIYKGKPIFYSLGDFAFMNNSLDQLPADMYEQYGVAPGSAATAPEILFARNAVHFANPVYYESVVAISCFAGGKVVEIRLHPIDLHRSAQDVSRGVPMLADEIVGRMILERLQVLSAPLARRLSSRRAWGSFGRAGEAYSAKVRPFQVDRGFAVVRSICVVAGQPNTQISDAAH